LSRENNEKLRYIKMISHARYTGVKTAEKTSARGRKKITFPCPFSRCPWQKDNGETVTCAAGGCVRRV